MSKVQGLDQVGMQMLQVESCFQGHRIYRSIGIVRNTAAVMRYSTVVGHVQLPHAHMRKIFMCLCGYYNYMMLYSLKLVDFLAIR